MGGWVVLPHPFQSHQKLSELSMKVDAIEGFNARCNDMQNSKAAELVAASGKPNLAASDAHFVRHIPLCMNFVELNASGFPWTVVDQEARPSGANWLHVSQIIKGLKRRQWRTLWAGGKGLIKTSILRPMGLRD